MSRLARPRAGAAPPYLTATLAKGLEVLEALSAHESVSLTLLARELGISGPTLFRMLATLVDCGYAEKSPDTGRYRATLKGWAQGAAVLRRLTLRDVARPHLERLLMEAREAPHLSVREGGEVVIIDRLEAPHPVRVETYLGQRVPLYCSAMGKAMLALEPEAALTAALLAAPLVRHTPETLVDPQALQRALRRVRRQGYATNQEEWRRGVCAIAVAIAGPGGAAPASLSLTMPTERFQPAMLESRFLPALRRAQQAIDRDLGAVARPG